MTSRHHRCVHHRDHHRSEVKTAHSRGIGRVSHRNAPSTTMITPSSAAQSRATRQVGHIQTPATKVSDAFYEKARELYEQKKHGDHLKVNGSSNQVPGMLIDPNDGLKYHVTHHRLGEGGFSVCYVVESEKGEVLAAKFFTRKITSSLKRLKRYEEEVGMMQNLNHPNIVGFHGGLSGIRQVGMTYRDFERGEHVSFYHPPVVFLEYCKGGSLGRFLKSRLGHNDRSRLRYGTLSEDETDWVAESMCKALVYLMDHRIIHRDIKLGNILLKSEISPSSSSSYSSSLNKTDLVLCDFGLAVKLRENEHFAKGTAGTPNYLAPEVLKHEGACFASDMWSLGVTLFYCVTGRCPFEVDEKNRHGHRGGGSKESRELYRKIRHVDYTWHSREKREISKSMRHLIDSMLEEHPIDRITPMDYLQGEK